MFFLDTARSSDQRTRARIAKVIESDVAALLLNGRSIPRAQLTLLHRFTDYSRFVPYIEAIMQRRSLIKQILSDLPRLAARSGALMKFARMILGAAIVYETYRGLGRSSCLSAQYVVDVGLCFGVGYSVFDTMFDNKDLIPDSRRRFFNQGARTIFDSANFETRNAIPFPALRRTKDLLHELERINEFRSAQSLLARFADSQFNPDTNVRLSKNPDLDAHELLRSTCRQAALARASMAACFGVAFSDQELEQLSSIAMHNQLTNDIEGVVEDANNCITVYVDKRIASSGMAYIYAATQDVVEAQNPAFRSATREILHLRILEGISWANKTMRDDELSERLRYWLRSNLASNIDSDADIILEASKRVTDMHKEYAVLRSISRGMHRARRESNSTSVPSLTHATCFL